MITGVNASTTPTSQRLTSHQTLFAAAHVRSVSSLHRAQPPVILSEAKNPRISPLPLPLLLSSPLSLHLHSSFHPKPRHPKRSSLRTLQAAQPKDPDTAHLTKTAQPILPTTPTGVAVAVVVASALAVALAPGVGPGFSPDIQTHHENGL